MKIISQPIEMIAWFKDKDYPKPLKFRMATNGSELVVIKINKIHEMREEKLAGIKSYVYKCSSFINNVNTPYELKYIIDKCQWVLYKL